MKDAVAWEHAAVSLEIVTELPPTPTSKEKIHAATGGLKAPICCSIPS